MRVRPATPHEPDTATKDFYVDAMRTLNEAKVPYAVGGGYAVAYYTGIARNTKDLDLFVKPEDRDRTLKTLARAGYRTEFFYPYWISKALSGEAFIDILYDSGNGLCPVDDDWFGGPQIEVLGYRTRLVPAEEQLWSKAFVQDRDRFDGADVIHLLICQGKAFDWKRVLRRFEGHERVLLAHILLAGYAYPTERDCVPGEVIGRLEEAIKHEPQAQARICRGPFIAQKGFGVALSDWGFADARLKPHGPLTAEAVEQLPKQ